MGDFVGSFDGLSLVPATTALPDAKPSFRAMYIRVHNLLKPLTKALTSQSHLLLSSLFPPPVPPLRLQSQALRLLSSFLSPEVQPLSSWQSLRSSLRLAIDRFEANLLSEFEIADSKADENAMREAAEASWNVWQGHGEWELGKVWAEKREIFYEQGRWNPLDNFTETGALAFDAMDILMTNVLEALRDHGARAVRVFPPESNVLLSFADRIAVEVVCEYIAQLLTRAREISNAVFLQATAATFKEAWRMVDTVMQVAEQRADCLVTRTKAEDVVYRMFETNMDEYLDEEVESLKHNFDVICRSWDKQTSQASTVLTTSREGARFLGSQNPAQVKRNVLASFTDVLLLPVTIVPRTVGAVGAALQTGGTAAAQGIAMLNPQRWGGSGAVGSGGSGRDGYSRDFQLQDGDNVLFEFASMSSQKTTTTAVTSVKTHSVGTSTTQSNGAQSDKMELLLSLDIALELIHADREALKRAETFAGYPGHYGHRVHDTMEEIFILLLQTMSEKHLVPGFNAATERMRAYKPAEHSETTSVAPLMQFFELVHVGDTIQSMVQVYFDKELAPRIDKTDFLNGVVREKKRFENALDDSVAAGLNAGTEVLMNQVEHIILTLTQPREYYPPDDAPPLELGPTKGCQEVIKCLDMHCQLLKGSTTKDVLEVFYQEVGWRLIAILQKHIKRQIISLTGGFQLIADLNAYHAFIASLKVPSITAEFSHLKMLGHVYVVDDAKDLAQIVRDVTRYGGAYKPEDIYEFIQRRADWKKIEKTVDKTMYNLSFKEDCIVC
ncbi:hypothetical protein GLOTRDRAFT_50733 [Gloeophyllum trabeum ATCC 11539]|uniref:Exocyst complex component Sec10-like alpha-helical bundle domain-containing protein n=1 Tax=Gloeophyllum trabeum (strain ATCC 11539 / FP-39264 / Madison 617) TaxID=670483 RepID=S7PR44_GLOTA|nr:uncharacterized protein GLOTRDRAFT_50733 [Gloeophyllum trabeum ATCC 11539]EPQ50311.1 hypothetical protein GLOTRDRAFT_50733 [Gloeophyllum trabeum ATCC 11539]